MKLDLRFTSVPLGDLECDTLIVFAFQGSLQNIKGTSDLDAKTWGMLAGLREKGFWSGIEGETLLVPSQNMLKAKKVLVKGLGVNADYGRKVLAKGVKDVSHTLDRMKVCDMAIRIPVMEGTVIEYCACVEIACIQLLNPFLSRHKDERDFLLRIMVSLDAMSIHHLEKTVARLRAHFNSKINYTIIFDRKGFAES